MNDIERNHHVHDRSDNEGAQHPHNFYWRRAHRDWRVWVAVLLMIACVIIYVMSDNLSLRPGKQQQQPMPAVVAE